MRHGRENAVRDIGSQEPDRHLKPLRPLPHGTQTRHDEPARKIIAIKNVHEISYSVNIPLLIIAKQVDKSKLFAQYFADTENQRQGKTICSLIKIFSEHFEPRKFIKGKE